jgi:predicted DNA-binding antitoxin AbrB/MazE fold protein
MTTTVTATFENGVLRPDQALPLAEHERVTLTIQPIDEGWSEEKAQAAWEEFKEWIKRKPLHGLGPRMTRDELHERR